MYSDLSVQQTIAQLKRMGSGITVASDFAAQVCQVKKLLRQDSTGLVCSTIDFMVHAATTSYKMETSNATLDGILGTWQKSLLNRELSPSIPRGLRDLSTEYFRERWSSSFIGIRLNWEEMDVEGKKWILPSRIYFVDGGALRVDAKNKSDFSKWNYYLNNNQDKPLVSSEKESIIIRKPFSSLYEVYPTPYLVRRGTLFNALVKQMLITKQADTIYEIISYLFLIKAGNQKLQDMGISTTEEDLRDLKNLIVKSVNEHQYSGEIGKLIAALSGDVSMEHLIPDITKIMDEKNMKTVDKNILASLGYVELPGFSNTRQEAMLNPQPLVNEVKDAVSDWAAVLEEIGYMILEKNSKNYPTLTNNEIKVVPGRIKVFLTDNMKRILGLAMDKGIIDFEDYSDSVLDREGADIILRRQKEHKDKLDTILTPRQTQFIPKEREETATPPKKEDPEVVEKNEKQGKTKGSPEARNFKTAETIDDLPEDIKKALSVPAQIIFLKASNKSLLEGRSEADANSAAFSSLVDAGFYEDKKGKWKKQK